MLRRKATNSVLPRWLEDDANQGQTSNNTNSTNLTSQCPPIPTCTCPDPNNPGGGGVGTDPIILKFLVPELGYANFASMLHDVAENYYRVSSRPVKIIAEGLPSNDRVGQDIFHDVKNKLGQYDGYVFYQSLVGEIAGDGGLFDLTNITRNYERNPSQWLDILPFYRDELSTYDGKVLLTPFDGDVFNMYYRKDLFTEHGKSAPKTWDEYLELAEYFHSMEVEVPADPMSPNGTNKTLIMAGSCYGRTKGCGGPYWAQSILGTMTQTKGAATGSLFDTQNFDPLLGDAMVETIRIMEEQARFGSPDEFEGCTNINTNAMNEGRCAMTISWGNSFTQHTAEGSVIEGKLGVASTPGSPRVLDRETGLLVDCTEEICPNGFDHVDSSGKKVRVNRAPYAAYGGFVAGVSNNVNREHQELAADFIIYASDVAQAQKYVIPDRTSDAATIPTGQDPWRYKLLEPERWIQRGYPANTTRDYLQTIDVQLSDKNVIADLRFPKAAAIYTAMDDEMFDYLNATILLQSIPEGEKAQERKAMTQRIQTQWEKIITEYNNEPTTSVPLLETYQKIRGVYKPPELDAVQPPTSTISTGTIAGIVLASCFGVAVFASFLAAHLIKRDRKKRDEDNWFISSREIKDTGDILGQGSFGVVTKGFFRGSAVALKHPVDPARLSDSFHQAADGGWHLETMTDATTMVPSVAKFGKKKKPDHPLQKELMTLVKLRHPNIVETLGATIVDTKLIIVLQYMRNNTVRSILKDPNGVAGTAIYSVEVQWALQVARGLAFLHSTPPPIGPMLHNDLKSSNVLIDEAFNAHISDFGLASTTVKGLWGWSKARKRKPKGSLLWMAPEILNGAAPSPASDVYSYAMFLCELMTRHRPFQVRALVGAGPDRGSYTLPTTESGRDSQPIRVAETEVTVPPHDTDTTEKNARNRGNRISWAETGSSGHDTGTVQNQNTKDNRYSYTMNTYASADVVEMVGVVNGKEYTRDQIVDKVKDISLDPPFRPDLPDGAPLFLRDICIEAWHKNPKRRPTMKEIEERLSAAVSTDSVTHQLVKRSTMFDSVVPRDVQEKLMRGESVPPKPYDEASVLFSDIVGFTTISSCLTAEEVGDMIFRMISNFDQLRIKYKVKKLDIIGDAFLGVVGVPNKVPNHATNAAKFALEAIEACKQTLICPKKPELGHIRVRFGICSGPVVATVIGGAEHPKYTLFGDTVNVASRMESSGEPNKCQCTESTADLILEEGGEGVDMTERGMVAVKGKGEMKTFWLSLSK